MAFEVRPQVAYWTARTGRYWISDDELCSFCSTEQGRVSEVHKAKYTGGISGSSWLLSVQVCNLHCYSSEVDIVWAKKEDKIKEDFHYAASEWDPCGSSTGPEYVQSPFETSRGNRVNGTHCSVLAFMSALHLPPTIVPIVLAFHPQHQFQERHPRTSPAHAITPWLGFNASPPMKLSSCCRCVLGVWTWAQLMNQSL